MVIYEFDTVAVVGADILLVQDGGIKILIFEK